MSVFQTCKLYAVIHKYYLFLFLIAELHYITQTLITISFYVLFIENAIQTLKYA